MKLDLVARRGRSFSQSFEQIEIQFRAGGRQQGSVPPTTPALGQLLRAQRGFRVYPSDPSQQKPSTPVLGLNCCRLSSSANTFTQQRLRKELTISEQQGPVFSHHHFLPGSPEPLSSPTDKSKIPSDHSCFSISGTTGKETIRQQKARSASSHGKINGPTAPQLPFLHGAERSPQCSQIPEVCSALREPHTQNYFQAFGIQSERSLASPPFFSVDASHSLSCLCQLGQVILSLISGTA